MFLLSQMIHNQEVNSDLLGRGVRFIMDTDGTQLIPWDELTANDIVIIPAFGTTLEIEARLNAIGLEVQRYNTTCPFVEKVWNRSEKLGNDNYTVIIHGKPRHEETRATFSHAAAGAPAVIVRDIADAQVLGEYIHGRIDRGKLDETFSGKVSGGFNPDRDLHRVGVVNQTTMLATETQAIADYFRQVMIEKYGADSLKEHFADTRDTLCYATNDNQDATYQLLETDADIAIVVGGYNSSNTSHIVELCERKFPTYFINAEGEIKSKSEIQHFNFHSKKRTITSPFLPDKNPVKIILTSGASCPDTLVDRVMLRILEFFTGTKPVEDLLKSF